jgi:hypothetical protein
MKKFIGTAIILTLSLTGFSGAKGGFTDTSTLSISKTATSKSPFEKGYYDYQGYIGNNMPIHMSIYLLEKDMVGSYFYDSMRTEIKLKGKVGSKDIELYEYNDADENTGIFKGTISTVDKMKEHG